jgi:hypothetical protein
VKTFGSIDQPWLAKKDWASGKIRDDSLAQSAGLWVFTLLWNGISWPISIIALRQGDEIAVYFVLLFPVVGLILLGVSLYLLFKLLKFGRSHFEMAEVPGALGGCLGGMVRCRLPQIPRDGVKVRLICQQTRVSGSGKNKSTVKTILWEDRETVARHNMVSDSRETIIPVYFEIPWGCEPTGKVDSRIRIDWILSVDAALPGIDYKKSFKVPVFRCEQSRADFVPTRRRDAVSTEPVMSTRVDWTRYRLLLSQPDSSGAWTIERQPGVNLKVLIPSAMVSGVLTAVGAVLWLAVGAAGVGILLLVIGTLVGLAIPASLFYQCSIRIMPGAVSQSVRFLSWESEWRVSSEQYESIQPVPAHQMGNTQYYNLAVKRKHGGNSLLRVTLPDYELADQLASRIQATIRSS